MEGRRAQAGGRIFTLRGHGTSELVIKRSRFIGQAYPLESESEARTFIDRVRADHKAAAHNVYAYRVGKGAVVERFDDDGEPGGTAGVPVLSVIRKENLTDTLVVVTRHFGGILLGARGLVRAYGEAAAAAIRAAGTVAKEPGRELCVAVEYPLWGRVRNLIESRGYSIEDITYTDHVEVKLAVPYEALSELEGILGELRPALRLEEGGERYVTVG